MNIKRIGIDLAKQVFQVHGVDSHEQVVLRKRLKREQMHRFFKELPPCLISKRGDTYLRTLLIHGARAALNSSASKEDRRSRWVQALATRRNRNIAKVALANKNARIAWAVLSRQETYRGAATNEAPN